MLLRAVIILASLLVPEALFACSKHAIHVGDSDLTSAAGVLVKMVMLAGISIPVGLAFGKWRRLSAVRKWLLLLLAAASLTSASTYRAQACHGAETVRPILEKIHAAQLDYHRSHGTYASSFDDLGFAPPAGELSYFLPLQVLAAKNTSPKKGVDLRRLPPGIAPAAATDRFTAVAIGFAEPDRIDVWTMDDGKRFKEWSLAAFSKAERDAQGNNGEPWLKTFALLLNKFEGLLMLLSLLLGLSLGFAYSLRIPAGTTVASS